MKLEDQVCSLELSKRLKELGVEQESYFYWCEDLGEVTFSADCRSYIKAKCGNHPSAFTVAEIGTLIPFGFESHRDHKDRWYCCSEEDPDNFMELGDTEADARAKMLIYLIENKLLPTKSEGGRV